MWSAELKRGAVAAIFAGGLCAAAPALAWEPTKPIEIIVPAGAGGATDQMARMIQAAVQKNNLLKVPTVVSLKGGASGGEGLMDMKASAGDPYKFIIAQSSIYTLPFSAKLPFSWKDMTPVAIIALDEFVLWVNSGAPYKTTAEFTAAAKKAGTETLRMGGTGSKREDQILTAAIEKATGAKFAYIPYKSGGEAATQLVGNHTEANVNNPSENVAQWRAGQVRALCLFDTTRLPYDEKVTSDMAWKDIPTCKEVGLDIDYTMLRGIFLPGKVTPDQVAFYQDLFHKIAQTPEYKDYLKNQALKAAYIEGEAMTKFLQEDEARHKALMTEAGFIASN
ncbi:Bug family tripartite tricarboxylate transporter substrate binding protein [Roseixanthobacter pseudopolyaromaticivorans]|uniref:Bug family tripartite tricarboxylate transporter substrate binding protein n=1 Tax=Xanthobacteraceae TaxID=335928 RepID=UPI00372624CD